MLYLFFVGNQAASVIEIYDHLYLDANNISHKNDICFISVSYFYCSLRSGFYCLF